VSGKSYMGSSVNLSKRLNDYLNIAFLDKERVEKR
jgi:hypothetical protein